MEISRLIDLKVKRHNTYDPLIELDIAMQELQLQQLLENLLDYRDLQMNVLWQIKEALKDALR